jgi:hypothetical protein
LHLLPISVAIRTAICDSPETARVALTSFSENQCAKLVKAITASDAERILKEIGSVAGRSEEGDSFPAISAAWPNALIFQADDEKRRALWLFIACCRKNPSLGGESLREATIAMCGLDRYLHEHPRNQEAVLAAIREYNLVALIALLGIDEAQSFAPLFRCAPDTIDALLQRVVGEPVVDADTRRETRFTAFGGAFLLLPLLDEFPFEAATFGWPECGEIGPATITRFLVLAKCLGACRARGCLQDSVIRDLMRVSEIDSEEMANWLATLTTTHLQNFLCEIAKWHLDLGAMEGETFFFTRVAEEDEPVAMMLDLARGLWVFAGHEHQLQDFAASGMPQSKQLLCHESLWRTAQIAFPQSELRPLSDLGANTGLRPDSLQKDLKYLSLPEEICGPRAVDLALSVAAQTVLRRFAWKLPGFALSSLEYLHSNFLDCCAGIERSNEQYTVCLHRPPLHLVLGIAGLNRRSYNLSWLDGRAYSIFPEG